MRSNNVAHNNLSFPLSVTAVGLELRPFVCQPSALPTGVRYKLLLWPVLPDFENFHTGRVEKFIKYSSKFTRSSKFIKYPSQVSPIYNGYVLVVFTQEVIKEVHCNHENLHAEK